MKAIAHEWCVLIKKFLESMTNSHFFTISMGWILFYQFSSKFRHISCNLHITEVFTDVVITLTLKSYHFDIVNTTFNAFIELFSFIDRTPYYVLIKTIMKSPFQ